MESYKDQIPNDDKHVPEQLKFLFSSRGAGKRRIKPVDPNKLVVDFPDLLNGDDNKKQSNGDDNSALRNAFGDISNGEEEEGESDEDYVAPKSVSISNSCSDNDDDKVNRTSEKSSNSDDDDDDSSQDNDGNNSNNNAVVNLMQHVFGSSDSNSNSNSNVCPTAEADVNSIPCPNVRHATVKVCSVCLRTNSDTMDEIVQCDNCGVFVHESCYGLMDETNPSNSQSPTKKHGSGDDRSSVSSFSTEPWFCEPCLHGVDSFNLTCELCPTRGRSAGAYKSTVCNRWCHISCALVCPNVAFRYPAQLKGIDLTEIHSKQWAQRLCSSCVDPHMALSGLCISCDAGMCKMSFHATCAQREGYWAVIDPLIINNTSSRKKSAPTKLRKTKAKRRKALGASSTSESDSESSSDRVPRSPTKVASQQHLDAFVVHCKRHSDPDAVRNTRKRFLLAQQSWRTGASIDTGDGDPEAKEHLTARIRDKLQHEQYKHQEVAQNNVGLLTDTHTPLPLTASPFWLAMLSKKSKLHDVEVYEDGATVEGSQGGSAGRLSMAAIAPSFNTQFVTYFANREEQITELEERLLSNAEEQYQSALAEQEDCDATAGRLHQVAKREADEGDDHLRALSLRLEKLNRLAAATAPLSKSRAVNVMFQLPEAVRGDKMDNVQRSVKGERGVANEGFFRSAFSNWMNKKCAEGELSQPVTCVACGSSNDKHLMLCCDTCSRYYHCHCCVPPIPKAWTYRKNENVKGRRSTFGQWAWQCMSCVPTSSDSDINAGVDDPSELDGPRQLRTQRKQTERLIEQHSPIQKAVNRQRARKQREKMAIAAAAKESEDEDHVPLKIVVGNGTQSPTRVTVARRGSKMKHHVKIEKIELTKSTPTASESPPGETYEFND